MLSGAWQDAGRETHHKVRYFIPRMGWDAVLFAYGIYFLLAAGVERTPEYRLPLQVEADIAVGFERKVAVAMNAGDFLYCVPLGNVARAFCHIDDDIQNWITVYRNVDGVSLGLPNDLICGCVVHVLTWPPAIG